MTTWKSTYISAVVHRSTEDPMLDELATRVHIIDEGAGAFVEIEDEDGNKLRFDPDELYLVAETAQKMLCDIDNKPNIPTDDRLHKAARDLLAVIHRDGGHHTGKVGFVQSCKDAEAIIIGFRSVVSDALNKHKDSEWTSTKPTNGGVYWVQLDRGLAPATVEIYRLDEDDVWRMRVVGDPTGIIASTRASCKVSSLNSALWNGPLSAPALP